MRINTAHLPADLRARMTDAIYGHILDGADVLDAVALAAGDARAEALAAGWAPVMVRFVGDTVTALGRELVADMVRNLAAAS
ncbi:hypothetical protein [Micromonospora coerulea]|uniref:hypothetical protein n=1 Tax=Micromonospora coerulea TaxID=47856 RepID=UPI001905800D|nr:hypothetical protein [Micromonospora veneta]